MGSSIDILGRLNMPKSTTGQRCSGAPPLGNHTSDTSSYLLLVEDGAWEGTGLVASSEHFRHVVAPGIASSRGKGIGSLQILQGVKLSASIRSLPALSEMLTLERGPHFSQRNFRYT